MKFLAALLAFALLVPQGIQPAGGITTTHGTSYPDITFWLNFEENDNTGAYDMGASECSKGDTSGAYTSSAQVQGTTKKVGSYALYAGTPNGDDYMTFAVSSDNIVSGTDGRIGLWFFVPTGAWAETVYLVDLNFESDANNYMFVRTTGTDELQYRWRQGGSTQIDTASTTANLAENTWYFLEIKYDTAANTAVLYINGSAVITDSTDTTAIATLSTLHINGHGDNTNYVIDNVMISNDPTRAFYTDGATDLSVTTSKPTGACS